MLEGFKFGPKGPVLPSQPKVEAELQPFWPQRGLPTICPKSPKPKVYRRLPPFAGVAQGLPWNPPKWAVLSPKWPNLACFWPFFGLFGPWSRICPKVSKLRFLVLFSPFVCNRVGLCTIVPKCVYIAYLSSWAPEWVYWPRICPHKPIYCAHAKTPRKCRILIGNVALFSEFVALIVHAYMCPIQHVLLLAYLHSCAPDCPHNVQAGVPDCPHVWAPAGLCAQLKGNVLLLLFMYHIMVTMKRACKMPYFIGKCDCFGTICWPCRTVEIMYLLPNK